MPDLSKSPVSKTCASSPSAAMPRMFYDYADSGSYTGGTYRSNESTQRIKLRQRVAVNMEGPYHPHHHGGAGRKPCRWRLRPRA